MSWHDSHEPKDLIGKVLKQVTTNYDDELNLEFEDGYIATFYHSQDCCESVQIESTNREIDTLKLFEGQTLTNCWSDAEDYPSECGSATKTTLSFQFGTERVEIVWLGESNGYYSESVSMSLTFTGKELD